MKLIGADEIFGLLSYVAVLISRQKLRRNRGIKNTDEDISDALISAGIRIVSHHILDEGLRYTCINAVHAHMVAIICCPSERKLREVTGTDNNTVERICHIH